MVIGPQHLQRLRVFDVIFTENFFWLEAFAVSVMTLHAENVSVQIDHKADSIAQCVHFWVVVQLIIYTRIVACPKS
jgi:hypothetical protein